MRVILLGPPGSGKGTQGDLIEERFRFPKISTGDLLRQAVRENTPLGKRAQAEMNKGRLVSDEIVEQLVREKLAEPALRSGYVLDGFPRNRAQADALERMQPRKREVAIEIQVDSGVVVRRLGARRVCPRCRAVYSLEARPPHADGVCDNCGSELIQREDGGSKQTLSSSII